MRLPDIGFEGWTIVLVLTIISVLAAALIMEQSNIRSFNRACFEAGGVSVRNDDIGRVCAKLTIIEVKT